MSNQTVRLSKRSARRLQGWVNVWLRGAKRNSTVTLRARFPDRSDYSITVVRGWKPDPWNRHTIPVLINGRAGNLMRSDLHWLLSFDD